jgi:hypothetical protein
MDEILASIRRIIESNEPVLQGGVATAAAEPSGFNGRPANDDSEEVSLTVDDRFADSRQNYAPTEAVSPPLLRAVADADVRESEPSQAVPFNSPAPQKSLSLADVAARVRAASERGAVRDHAPPHLAAAEHPARPVVEAAAMPMAAERMHEVAAEPENDTRMAPVEVAGEEQPLRGESMSLLSSTAGEQVARSFQDLALAVESAERRSLDEIAEEMLRPMLQEWLDDNLPTLVERLVREEIERVVRGPRR